MDGRRNKARHRADFLADADGIAHCNAGLAGRANMLGKRNHRQFGRRRMYNGTAAGQRLSVMDLMQRVNTSAK